MKINLFASALTAVAALFAAQACQQMTDTYQIPEEGCLTVNIVPSEDMSLTKAVTAYTTAHAHESNVNSVQLFVFDSAGTINIYKDLGTSLTGTISTTVGTKKVWAVINGPTLSSVKTESELKAYPLDLSANNRLASKGFVMTGSGTCTVTAGASTPCEFSVSRLVARIALTAVVNNLPPSLGSMVLDQVMLCNVVGNQSIGGTAEPSTWYNKEGRADEETRNAAHIIDGSTYKASCEELTYAKPWSSVASGATHTTTIPYLMYTYPNSATTSPSGFSATFAPQRTVLTLTAKIQGTKYYYPVVLDDTVIERNKSYTVGITVTGLGSTDPNTPVSKGSISVTVSVAGWDVGTVYNEEI